MTPCNFSSGKDVIMYTLKIIGRSYIKIGFASMLRVNDGNSRSRIQNQDPDPDPLTRSSVRGYGPGSGSNPEHGSIEYDRI
jgi:hypothetical protein